MLNSDKNIIVSAPTSFGKSLLIEEFIAAKKFTNVVKINIHWSAVANNEIFLPQLLNFLFIMLFQVKFLVKIAVHYNSIIKRVL